MILYKNKYLKYKNKYLDLKKIVGGANKSKSHDTNIDVQKKRVDDWAEQFKKLNFNILYNIDQDIKYNEDKKYNISYLKISRGASDPLQKSITQILESLKEFNITGDLILSNNNIVTLPANFCKIIIGGNLYLDHNNLTKLPEKFNKIEIGGSLYLNNNKLKIIYYLFTSNNIVGGIDLGYNELEPLPYYGSIKIGGSLNLCNNRLDTLPESFGNISVQGELNLSHNQLSILPESFGKMSVHGNLNLSHNQLSILPESFGKTSVPGDLNLSHNQLSILPNFENIKIGGSLFLQNNKLEQLPDIFNINIPDDYNMPFTHNINVTGHLRLHCNKLKTLPESFGNIHITGDLTLSYNQLRQLPIISIINIEGKFDLFKNQLYEVPTNFSNIYVNDLNLGENNLRELPDNFGDFECVGDLNLSHNLLKVLPSNFGEIHVGGDLNLSYNLLKILPTNFENVGKKILLNNNYIISTQPPDNCVRKLKKKNYCHLEEQTIEGLESYEENKKCSNCKEEERTCKKCAICKNEDVWYCSEECEKNEWCGFNWVSHRNNCNNIINTTFIISAHGVMEHSDTPIEDKDNMSIITLSLLGESTYFEVDKPLIDIYTNNNSLFNDNDKTLTLTENGKEFYETCKYLDVNLMNRLNENNEYFNNISLQFYDERPNIAKLIRIHCFKKHENGHIEIIDNYLHATYNRTKTNSVDVINQIVENERRYNNNRGHITFIFIACRGLPKIQNRNIEAENALMRVKSSLTTNNTIEAHNSEDTVTYDTLAEENEKEKAKDKQKKEELENTFASQLENQFNNSKNLIDDLISYNNKKFKSLDV